MTNQRQFFQRPRLWGLLCGLTLAAAQFFSPAGVGIAQAATTTCTPNGATQNCTVTFSASGAPETWTVPAGVTSATFDLYGAQGGGGGLGGRVTATLAVTPGASYQVRVGVWGYSIPLPRGYNGGGAAVNRYGGGAADVRSGAFGLADRLLVAGGGGGGGFNNGGGGSGGAGGNAGSTGAAQDGAPGDGGSAGFGGGVGSAGDGTGGGGGSGLGGAIFVRNGGKVTITGSGLFENNSVLAGSSNNART